MDYIELKCEITPYNEAVAQILIAELESLATTALLKMKIQLMLT